jgi:hypothetical protein
MPERLIQQLYLQILKKIVAILLLLVYLFTTTEFYQLIKLPSLFEHLAAHKAGDKNETIWSFLVDHYGGDSANNPDKAADMQLPFKQQNESVAYNISTIIFIPHQFSFNFKVIETEPIEFAEYKQPFGSYLFPSKIWQPPKCC